MSGHPAVVGGTLLPDSFAREVAARDGADSRRARAHRAFRRWWAQAAAAHGPASSPRALYEGAGAPLLGVLGYRPEAVSLRAARDQVAVVARTRGGTALAVLTTPWNARPHEHWRDAVSAGARLGTSWCLVFDGTSLAAVDASRPYSRRHLTVALQTAAEDEAAFGVLWATLRADCLEARRGPCELDRLVQQADRRRALTCAALDRGVRTAHDRLHAALSACERRRGGSASPPVTEQALTLVFRLLFLLYAESRGLLPLDHPIYREGYSLATLAARAGGHGSDGLWAALRALMRVAHAGCRVRDLEISAFNGRLFAPERAPLAERNDVGDGHAQAALSALAWRAAGHARVQIPYGELGVEQLGAIYERLIDAPGTADDSPRRARSGPARKATGTFYTPSPLTHFLVRRTLAPLVEGVAPEAILRLRVLDPAMGSGAFLVAACHYLASAYERALVRSGEARPGDFSAADRAEFLRSVAQHCLYGVDNNPMAVQLARLSLWLTTLARDRPLSFLDHRLRVGDSLVGAELGDLARRPSGGSRMQTADARPLLAELDPSGPLRDSVGRRLALASTPDADAAIVRAKERELDRMESAQGPLHRLRMAVDAWCAAWFVDGASTWSPAITADLVASALRHSGGLRPAQREPLESAVRLATTRQRFFHWTLEFPEVFTDAQGKPRADGGFDAVIGNPPWDMVRAEDGTTREQARQLVSFARESGLYSRAQAAHVNRYQLFVERALDLLADGGRLGLIVPWGLLGDAGSARVRRRLFERGAVDAVVAFENRRGLFPIHRSVRFAACCATRGTPTRVIACRMGETDARALEGIPDLGQPPAAFPLTLTRGALESLAGEWLAVPAVRDTAALELLLRLTRRHLPLSHPRGWGATFGRELNATDDRAAFTARDDGPAAAAHGDALPVIEGKHLSPFRVDARAATRQLPASRVPRRLAARFARPRLAFRDVAGAGNRLTLIAAILPAATASTHTVCTLEQTLDERPQLVLCALLNSLVANWYVRHWVGTHVTAGLVARLPVPWIREGDDHHAALEQLARRCAVTDPAGDDWVELQVEAARAYGLTEAELRGVLDTFPLIAEGLRLEIARRFAREG